MSISRIQGNQTSSSGGTSLTITLPSGVTLGNLLVIAVAVGNNTTTINAPDTSWHQVTINQPAGSNATIETSIWYMVVDSSHAGGTSWTWTTSVTHSIFITLSEWSSTNGWPTNPVDVSANGDTVGSPVQATTIVSGTTAATAQAEELWVASLAYKGGTQTESSITTGWTRDLEATTGTANTMTMLYKVASATGTAACQYTIGTAQYWAGCIATFKDNASAPNPVLATSPGSLSFSATAGGTNPASQNSTLSETAGTGTAWTSSISYASGSGWLGISPTSGTLAAFGTASIAFSCTTGTLTAGTYMATVTFTATTGGATATVAVNFIIVAAPAPAIMGNIVALLINDVHYPTIRQESIQIDHTGSDPIPTFQMRLQDDPSQIPLSELMEVVFIDAGQIANPTHNVLVNPLMNPYTTSWVTPTLNTGATRSQNGGGGVTLTLANTLTGDYSILLQTVQVQVGQTYTFSAYVSGSSPVNAQAHLLLYFLDVTNTVVFSTLQTTPITPTGTPQRLSLTAQVPTNAYYIQANLMVNIPNATNSGSITFTSAQLETNAFTTGNFQLSYPTPDCNVSQANCTLMPDGTTIRQYRLFGGYITKAIAGDYIGPNRQWQVTVSGYGWLLGKQQLINFTKTNEYDDQIIGQIVSTYFPKVFSTAQVARGAFWDNFSYNYNGTARDGFDALAAQSGYVTNVDAYRVIWYQPPGYNAMGFTLSDHPDNITSFPYYNWSYDTDATQIGNATLVQGATNISAVEYDAQSIAYYNLKLPGQGTFWRTVNDSTITTTAAAQKRAIAENASYNYAQKRAHLTTQQLMLPCLTVLLTHQPDNLDNTPFLITKTTLTLKGFKSMQQAIYECSCDLGPFQPDMVNMLVKLMRKSQVSTNAIGTPVIGLMVTESMTFLGSIQVTTIIGSPGRYGVGIYGTNTYGISGGTLPTTLYGVGTYGDATKGYN